MRGTLDIIWTNQPPEFRAVNRPPRLAEFEALIGSQPDIIPQWDQHINYYGNLVSAIAVGNSDYRDPIQPFNYWATAMWHYVARARGTNIVSRITGPVVIITGDDEFMELALQS